MAILAALLALLVLCFYFIARTLVIMFGKLKAPVLRTFEPYGEEVFFCGWTTLLVWIIAAGFVIEIFFIILFLPPRTELPPSILFVAGGLLLGACVFDSMAHHYRPLSHLTQLLPVFPLWYRDIYERTSRYERRRLAYRWLWLPKQMRTIFNRSDRVFMDWADLVIMGSVMEEDPGTIPKPSQSRLIRDLLFEMPQGMNGPRN